MVVKKIYLQICYKNILEMKNKSMFSIEKTQNKKKRIIVIIRNYDLKK